MELGQTHLAHSKDELSEFPGDLIDALEAALNNKETKARVKVDRRFHFYPVRGDISLVLGTTIGISTQTVRYVDQQRLEIDRYSHVKTIRAQLSTRAGDAPGQQLNSSGPELVEE